MPHQRTRIRNATVSRLLGATAAGARVYPSRVVPFRKGDLPVLCVYTLDEVADDDGSAPRELTRALDLIIEGWVMPGLNVDVALDDLALEVETAMHADPYLGAPHVVSAVDDTLDTLTITAHGLVTGMGPAQMDSSGAVPGGAVRGQSYFIIVLDANTVQLALTEDGDPVDLTSAGTGTITLTVSTVSDSVLTRTDLELVETGDREVGVLTLTYAVTYRTYAPEAPAGLDDFERVHDDWPLVGGSAPDPDDAAEDLFTVEAP